MKECIEREAALASIRHEDPALAYAIERVPAADVREVTLCRDCFLHESCSTEDVFKFARLSEENRFCSVGSKERYGTGGAGE